MSSTSNMTGHARQTVKDAASQTSESVLEFGTQVLGLLGRMRDAEGHAVERLLHRMGLKRREGLTQSAAFFAAGAIVGAGAGLLFAPTTGKQLRHNIATLFAGRLDEVTSLIKPVLRSAEKKVADAAATVEKTDNGVADHPAR
jgi:YtxH-like protein